jgi:hypothetical protein
MATGLSCVWVGPPASEIPAPQVTLRRCELRAHTGDGIYFAGGSLTLEGCVIAAQRSGLEIMQGQITARGCVIQGCEEGISISGSDGAGCICQCMIHRCDDGIVEYEASHVQVEACDLRENGRDWLRLTTPAG